MPKPPKTVFTMHRPALVQYGLTWRPAREKQKVLDKYAITLSELDDLDEKACKVVYVTKPVEWTSAQQDATNLNSEVKAALRNLAENLSKEHPVISTDKGIFGGMPHIKNVRLSVGDILAKLYVYGSIEEILNIYSPDINEEQIKEAIAYAQDFLETACDPRQSPEIDG